MPQELGESRPAAGGAQYIVARRAAASSRSRATTHAGQVRFWLCDYCQAMFTLTLDDFKQARARIAQHIKHTPLLTSRQLSERTGLDVRLKAEMFQRVGSYKIRVPLNN